MLVLARSQCRTCWEGVGDNTIEEEVVGGISCGWVGSVGETETKTKGYRGKVDERGVGKLMWGEGMSFAVLSI